MHIATYFFGAAVALPIFCLAIPSRPVPHSLNQRTESTLSSGPFLIKSVIGCVINGIQGAAVGTGIAPHDSEGIPGNFIKRDSDTNEVQDGPGKVI